MAWWDPPDPSAPPWRPDHYASALVAQEGALVAASQHLLHGSGPGALTGGGGSRRGAGAVAALTAAKAAAPTRSPPRPAPLAPVRRPPMLPRRDASSITTAAPPVKPRQQQQPPAPPPPPPPPPPQQRHAPTRALELSLTGTRVAGMMTGVASIAGAPSPPAAAAVARAPARRSQLLPPRPPLLAVRAVCLPTL